MGYNTFEEALVKQADHDSVHPKCNYTICQQHSNRQYRGRFDNHGQFKGQTTPSVSNLLEENNIHVCLLPPNTTDRLQPLDVAVNKPAKEFYRRKFQEWYSKEVSQQIDELEGDVAALQPIDMGLSRMKELGANWIEQMVEYISDNPEFIVRGFVRSGISLALDGVDDEEDSEGDTSDDFEEENIENDEIATIGEETDDERSGEDYLETENSEDTSDQSDDGAETSTYDDENGCMENYPMETIVISSSSSDSDGEDFHL